MSRTLRRIGVVLLASLTAYVAIGSLLHHVVFALPAPPPASFPKVGDRLVSRAEGFSQTIVGREDDWVVSELVVDPHAPGPPLHYHETFDEHFAVAEGTLHVRVEDDLRQIRPGETLLVPAGVPHQPFNPAPTRVVVVAADGSPSLPLTFAACLVQLYALMDGPEPLSGLGLALQMSVIDPICDTQIAAVPGPVWKGMKLLLAPAARLLGYRNYYPELALH